MILKTLAVALGAGVAAALLWAGGAQAQRGGGGFPADPMSWTHAAPPGVGGGEIGGGGGRHGGGGGGGHGGGSVGNPLEASDGARLLAQAGVACRPSDGRLLASRGRAALYEVACHDGFGWMVNRDEKGEVTAFDCLSIATSSKGERHCLLPANRSQLPGLQAMADKAKTGCTVTDGVWQGMGGQPPISRYEALCSDGTGRIFDAPGPGSKADLSTTACKDAAAFGMTCTLSKPKS